MKQRITLLALSLLALFFAPPSGFRTANIKSTEPATPTPESSEIALLCKAAGVDPKDVIWRMRHGLTAKQAIEVAATNKLEGHV